MTDYPTQWELCTEDHATRTLRLAVPSGWLYVICAKDPSGKVTHQSTTFVPDARQSAAPTVF